MVILCRESPLKRCVRDEVCITLSVQQAEGLMHKAKVNYISGPAGAVSLGLPPSCTRCMAHNSVYVCTTQDFVKYLKVNEYKGTLVQNDKDLLRESKMALFN